MQSNHLSRSQRLYARTAPIAALALLFLLLTGQAVPGGTNSACQTVTNLAAANVDMLMGVSAGQKINLISAWCWCQGTCSTPAQISFEARETGTASTITDVTGAVTCQALTAAHSPTTVSGSTTIQAGDALRWDVDNAVSPETDQYEICVNYQK